MAWWLFLVICCLISHQCPPYTHHLIINYVLCDLFLLSHWYRSHTDHLIMMSWIPKSRPASTSPHKKGAPLHLKVNLYFLCCYNFLCFFFRFIDWAPPASPEGQLVTFFVLFFALTIFFVFFLVSFDWASQWENRVPQISDCFAAKTCYFYFLFGLCFRVDDFHFDCLCYSWFYKFLFHLIEVFDEKRDSHQSQMISRNSPDVHQTKREPVNYPNCFTHSVFFIFYIYCIACSINL